MATHLLCPLQKFIKDLAPRPCVLFFPLSARRVSLQQQKVLQSLSDFRFKNPLKKRGGDINQPALNKVTTEP